MSDPLPLHLACSFVFLPHLAFVPELTGKYGVYTCVSEDKVWDDGAPPPHFETLTDKKGDQELVMEGLLLAVLFVSCEQVLRFVPKHLVLHR